MTQTNNSSRPMKLKTGAVVLLVIIEGEGWELAGGKFNPDVMVSQSVFTAVVAAYVSAAAFCF